jgi:membrane-associated phospholipid phosphatase
VRPSPDRCAVRGLLAALLAALLLPGSALAEAALPAACPAIDPPAEPAAAEEETAPPKKPGLPVLVGRALLDEGKRWVSDAGALATNPLHWQQEDFRRFGLFAFTVGGLIVADPQIYTGIQDLRSNFTNSVSNATTDFGGPYAYAISGGLILGGLATKNADMRDTGREALEAAVFAGIITNVFKEVFGRVRPYASGGETIFEPFSGNKSFPSGHATTAFAVASVIAMRTDGWIVPTIAYGLATVVAFDRINDQAHFASDVFAGACIGIATGRFLVNRHRRQAEAESGKTEVSLVPIPSGMALRVDF